MTATVKLDPFSPPTVSSVFGRSLLMAGRPEEALPHLRVCAARLPDYAPCYHSLVMACYETGNIEEARRAWKQIQRLQPGWHPSLRAGPWVFGLPADEKRMLAAFEAVMAPHGP
jgi:predicted Zn-dependent protease